MIEDKGSLATNAPISRRNFLGQAAIALAGWTALVKGARYASANKSETKPNFLIILADDMGFSDAGCYGGEIATKNLDRLASKGLRFTQCYSTGRCWPSRSSILTGYYAQQVKMDPPGGLLPKWTRVLPHYLKPLGYRCYHSGKWHLHGAPKAIADGGFDRAYKINGSKNYFESKEAELDDKTLSEISKDKGFHQTTVVADYGIDFLKQHAVDYAKDPFFLYLAFTSPHFPLHALQEDIDRYRDRYLEGWDKVRKARHKRMREMGIVNCDLSPLDPKSVPAWNMTETNLQKRIGPGEEGHAVPWDSLTDEQKRFQATKMAIHAAMVDRMDREIGRVLDQLKKMKALDNTIIFFASDNGASAEQIIRDGGHDPKAIPGSAESYLCLGPGWSSASNTPFRLHKYWNHEGGISSPLIVHWPAGKLEKRKLRHDPAHFIDFLPTLLDMAGGKADVQPWNGETPPPLPGKSLVPAFYKDGTVQREFLFFHHAQNKAIRMGQWKLVSAVQWGDWELYDLKTDRCEMKNLAQKYPDLVRDMAAMWEQKEAEFRRQAGPLEKKKKTGS